VARQAGVSTLVLKAHEGSTVERAALAGPGLMGGVVLNSPVGGANPDAVRVAAALGGRVVWLPTVSATAHIAAHARAELSVHRGLVFAPVPVCDGERLRPEWLPVLEAVAEHDLALGSGHVSLDETLCVFQAAAERGVQRLLVNHPRLPFLGWRDEHADALQKLGARIEVGVLADHLSETRVSPTEYFLARYPSELLVFGSDLGHTSFPDYAAGVREWMQRVEPLAGAARMEAILTKNGRELLDK
jgi:hypothetical protein